MSFEFIETYVTPHLLIPINMCLSSTPGASSETGTAVLLQHSIKLTILVALSLYLGFFF